MRLRKGEDPFPIQGDGFLDRFGKTRFRLVGQAVEEIHVDAYSV